MGVAVVITLRGETEPLLNSFEVARLFRVDRKVPGRWAAKGLIPAILTPGGVWRFRASDVYAAIEASAESRTVTALSRPGSGEDGGPAPVETGPGRQH